MTEQDQIDRLQQRIISLESKLEAFTEMVESIPNAAELINIKKKLALLDGLETSVLDNLTNLRSDLNDKIEDLRRSFQL